MLIEKTLQIDFGNRFDQVLLIVEPLNKFYFNRLDGSRYLKKRADLAQKKFKYLLFTMFQ